MSRLLFLTFWGEPRWDEGVKPHESPGLMTVPLIALAALATVGGLVNTPWKSSLEHFLEPAFEGVHQAHLPAGATPWALALISITAGLIGIAVAYRRYVTAAIPEETGPMWDRLEHGYYVDDLYGRTIVLPGKKAAEELAFTADAKGIDGIVNGVGALVEKVAVWAKPLQTGFVRSYGVGILGGAAAVLLFMLIRGGAL